MATTRSQPALFEPVVDSPTPPASSGPLTDAVAVLAEATSMIRSVEAFVAEAATDPTVSMPDLAGVIEAANQASRAAAGIETHAVAGYARRDETYDQDRPLEEPALVLRGRGFVHHDAGLEVAHILRISTGSGDTRTERAAALASRLPLTLAGVTAGKVELWQAHAILDETRLLTDDEARQC